MFRIQTDRGKGKNKKAGRSCGGEKNAKVGIKTKKKKAVTLPEGGKKGMQHFTKPKTHDQRACATLRTVKETEQETVWGVPGGKKARDEVGSRRP